MTAESRHWSPKRLGIARARSGEDREDERAGDRGAPHGPRTTGAASSPCASRFDIAGNPTMYSELNASDGSWKIRFVKLQIPSGATPPTAAIAMLTPCSRA